MTLLSRKKYTNQGFSLLEVMLALAVFAAVVVAGISFEGNKFMNAKIRKTAQQGQQIIEASLAYYNNQVKNYNTVAHPNAAGPQYANYFWPQNLTDLAVVSGQSDSSTTFLPKNINGVSSNGTFVNPFGHNWNVMTTSEPSGHVLPSNAAYFGIYTTVPKGIGERLVGMLPNATYYNSGSNDIVEIFSPVPGAVANEDENPYVFTRNVWYPNNGAGLGGESQESHIANPCPGDTTPYPNAQLSGQADPYLVAESDGATPGNHNIGAIQAYANYDATNNWIDYDVYGCDAGRTGNSLDACLSNGNQVQGAPLTITIICRPNQQDIQNDFASY